METIEISIIRRDGRIIDLIETEDWMENMEYYPENWDSADCVEVPKKYWDEGLIKRDNIINYLK